MAADIENAIKTLASNGIHFEVRRYGFCLLSAKDHSEFAQCGIDNDTSVSMSVFSKGRPTSWFCRHTFLEMAEDIVKAHSMAHGIDAQAEKFIESMEIIDETYDDTKLIEKTEDFVSNIEALNERDA